MPSSTGNVPPGWPAPAPLAAAGGNRCGHVPGAPRFALALPPDANPARPAPIAKAIARVRDYYRQPRESRWDELSQGERHRRLERQIDGAGGPDTGAGRALVRRLARWRQQRSERREALVAVLALLLHYTDIATLTVAVPSGDGWLGLSGPWIAARTGLSPSRVKRALATLSRSGLLAGTGQGRRFDRRRRRFVGAGWGPVRRFSFRLIRALGLEVSWDRAKKRLCKPRNPPPPAPYPTPVPAAAAADAALAGLSAAAGGPPARLAAPDRAAGAERARALRQALASPAARQAETDPAAHQARVERNRKTAELAARGLSSAEIRRVLDDAPQPP